MARWMSPSSSRAIALERIDNWPLGVKLPETTMRNALISSGVSFVRAGDAFQWPSILECRGQLTGLEKDRRLIVEFAELRVAGCGKRRPTPSLVADQPLRQAPGRFAGFAGDRLVSLQAFCRVPR